MDYNMGFIGYLPLSLFLNNLFFLVKARSALKKSQAQWQVLDLVWA